MKTITLEWFYYDQDGKTCSRCKSSIENIRNVVKRMTTPLKNIKVDIQLKEIPLPLSEISKSNTLKIDGTDIWEILDECKYLVTDCPECSDLTGLEIKCPAFNYKGSNAEVISEQMVEEAILALIASPSAKAKAEAVSQVICDCKDECSGTHPI
ncbi:MAG: DUF2703 domain-containing protein [Thermodesulfovibrionales bacterium]|nr:DUF2703 domain-containing protein [Thermodesulfovibrionales bacterium]